MKRSCLLAMHACTLLALRTFAAEPTPPIMPKIEETPLPPAIVLPAPATAPADVPNRPLTADEAARIALHHQPSIAMAAAGVDAARGQLAQAKAGLLPSIGSGAGYTATPVTAGSGGSTPAWQLTVNLRQLVYDFNHTRDLVRQSSAQADAATAGLSRARSDLIYQVKGAFYLYAQNARLVGVQEANLRNRQDHLALARARVQSGLGLPVDVVRAQTAVTEAIFSLNQAQNTASLSRVALAQLMGIDPRTPIDAAESDEAPVAADDPDALVQAALRQRPEVQQAKAGLAAVRYGLAAAKSGNAPALVGTAGWSDRGDAFLPSDASLTLGLAMQWAFLDSGLTAGKEAAARAGQATVQAQLEAVQLAVTADVAQAFLNLKTAEQRTVTAEAGVANAQEGVNLTRGRYNAGLGTFLDVLDAQAALVTAQTNLVNARSAVNQARAALAHAVSADALYLQQAAPRKQ